MVTRPIIQKPLNETERQNIENLYKQELVKQINQKRNKKAEEEANRNTQEDNQLSFIRNADLKRKEAQIQ